MPELTAPQFDFSIIMAVYNAEPFIKEALDSLIAQDHGFERIQVILVDDGSSDNSAQICDEYAAQYSNILSLHKENGGAASARNYGLQYAQGKYINFLDSDDKLSPNTCSAVYEFFQEHGNEVDLVSIPLMHFDAIKGPHILNYKYKQGNRVIDLDNEPNMIQLHMSSSFSKSEEIKGIFVDSRLTYAEDAKWVAQVLLKKRKIGVLKQAIYYYRKRSSGEESAIQKSVKNPAWYLPTLQYFTQDIINYCKNNYSNIPKFIQFMLTYELGWHIKSFDVTVLPEIDKEKYKEILYSVIKDIDDDIIFAQKFLPHEYKLLLLRHKYDTLSPEYAFTLGSKTLLNNYLTFGLEKMTDKSTSNMTVSPNASIKFIYETNKELSVGNISAFYDKTLISRITSQWFKIHFIEIENDVINIEGECSVLPVFLDKISICAYLDEKPYICNETIIHHPKCFLGEEVLYYRGFKVSIPITNGKKKYSISFAYKWKDSVVIKKIPKINLGSFTYLSTTYNNSHYINKGWLISASASQINLIKCSKKLALKSELRLIREIWKKNLLGGRKSLVIRAFVRIMKLLKRRPLLLISDRIMKADDNGEAFFRYMQKEHKEIRSYFVISKQSVDYEKIKKIGPVLDDQSILHKLLFFLADCIVSSQADTVTTNPFQGYDDAYKDLFQQVKFVFLQHGITQNDVSDWLNKYNKNFTGLVTAAKNEYLSFLDDKYSYSPKEVWLTGFPRFDRLYHNEKNLITIMPTWRKNLCRGVDPHTGIWQLTDNFLESEFYLFYSQLLKHPRLLAAAEKYGYQIAFFPHPTIQPYINLFSCSDKIKILDFNSSYRDIYAASNLVLTDYSSAVFDFAYLRKPVLYSHFDFESFFSGEHLVSKGYFDYERDGFGEVEYSLEGTVNRMIEYMENDCQLKDKYRRRIDDFFAFNDTNNCMRVYQKVASLLFNQQ